MKEIGERVKERMVHIQPTGLYVKRLIPWIELILSRFYILTTASILSWSRSRRIWGKVAGKDSCSTPMIPVDRSPRSHMVSHWEDGDVCLNELFFNVGIFFAD